MKCNECGAEIVNVLEKIEFAFGNDIVVVKNNPEKPCCQDCLQNTFFEVLDGISEL